jgi:hypothetical protein
MNPNRTKRTALYISIALRTFVVASMVLVSFLAFFNGVTTHACSDPDAAITDSCVSDNCVKAGLGNNTSCETIINQCVSASVPVGAGYISTNTAANCSNALASCYTSESDTSSCNNDGVLARVTFCNDGNINADGSGNCSIDNAIDANNAATGGTDFTTNRGLQAQRKTDAEAACSNAKQSNGQPLTIQQAEQCKTDADNDLQSCYSQLGGTATQVTNDKFNQCMQTKAGNANDCSARGGKFTPNDPANPGGDGKCAAPPPPTVASQTCPVGDTSLACIAQGPGGNIIATQTHCGEATVNILACGTEQNGQAAPILNNVLRIVVSVLTILVGIAAVGGLAWASVLYAKAGDNQGNVTEAKELIRNIIIGILAYGFMIAIIIWLVPGGAGLAP